MNIYCECSFCVEALALPDELQTANSVEPLIFDFQRASQTGADQNASGCHWIQPTIYHTIGFDSNETDDAALSNEKNTSFFSTYAL